MLVLPLHPVKTFLVLFLKGKLLLGKTKQKQLTFHHFRLHILYVTYIHKTNISQSQQHHSISAVTDIRIPGPDENYANTVDGVGNKYQL